MRILFVIANYPPDEIGGYELRCKRIVETLSSRHDIFVLTTKSNVKNSKLEKNAVIRTLEKKRRQGTFKTLIIEWLNIKRLKSCINDITPDIVVVFAVNNLTNFLIPWMLSRELQVVIDDGSKSAIHVWKVLSRIHHKRVESKKDLIKMIRHLGKRLYFKLVGIEDIDFMSKWQNLCVCFNSITTMNYAESKGVPAGLFYVVHSGIETDIFQVRSKEEQSDTFWKVLISGRVSREKGTIDGIRLISLFKQMGLQIELEIVGELSDEVYVDEIKNKAISYGVEDLVRWGGKVQREEMPEVYKNSKFCFSPTYLKTGFSSSVLEAMACGCVVIGYPGEGIPEMVENGQTGFVVKEGDVLAVSELIIQFATEREKYSMIAKSARNTVEERFSMDRYVKELEQVWKSVI